MNAAGRGAASCANYVEGFSKTIAATGGKSRGQRCQAGAAWGHVREIVAHGNYAPYNFFPAITDTLTPFYLLGLLYAYWRAGGLEGKLGPET
jgi:hypothetical protein